MTDPQPDFRGAFTTGGAAVIPDTRVYDDLLKGAASLFREMVSGNPNYASLDGAAANWLEVYGATFGRAEGGRLPVGRSVPVDVDRFDGPQHARRSEHDLLVSLAQLAEEQLAEIKRLNARPSDSRSSANVKDSARGYDIDVKSYADGLLIDALDDAIREYARGKRELEALKLNGWQETIDAKREGAG